MAFKLRRDASSVLEDGTATGNVLQNDSLATQVTQVKTSTGSFVPVPVGGVTLQGLYGFLTLMSDGSYTYTATTDAAQRLRAGATASDTFTYIAVGGSSSGNTTLKFAVTGVNDAPRLVSTTATLATITEDQTANGGQTVTSFLQSSDVDSSALRGIAITGLASGNGQWQYSTNGRLTWSAVGTVADGAALLLRSSDYIRFVPNGADGTTAEFTYRAWDQTSGVAGSKVSASTNGGTSAFSTATATASIVVSAVNDAPVAAAASAAGIEDGPPIVGQVQATDVDSPTLSYALVANSAIGGSVTIDSATGNYSFTLAPNFNGTASFRFTASDGSLNSAATLVSIAVAGVNDAPVLTATSPTLTPITEDETANGGQTVGSFLLSSDVDPGALRGIALIGLTPDNGEWQYSIDGRATWSAVGAVADTAALLLRSSDYIRFVPNGLNGTTPDFLFRAWDQTSGAAGSKVDASINGNQTAFSTALGIATVVVTSVNDAPVGIASSAAGSEDGPAVTGQVQATDVDSTTLTYALVADSVVGGAVSLDPTTGNYSFTPANNFNGTASFRFTASDGSLTSSQTPVTIAIAAVNDAPVAVADSASTAAGTPLLVNVLGNDTDIDGDVLSIAAVANAANGTVAIDNGRVLYSPNAGFIGIDSFSYTISDGAGGTSQASAVVDVGLSSDQVTAVSVTFRQGANGYVGTVDTMLKQSRPNSNFDAAVILRPGLETAKEVQALLRFDQLFGTGPGQIPVGAQILSATLTLDVTGASASGGTLNRMLVNWTGSSNWTSLGSGVQVNGIEATVDGAITLGSVAPGSRVFNVTDSLAAWNAAASTSAQNAANFGWVLMPSNDDPWEFTSSQGAVRPALTVTYTLLSAAPAMPTVSISAGAAAAESAAKVSFSLTLSQASTRDITVSFSTVDHTAKAGSDYLGAVQSVTFLAGETTKSFDIGLIDNSLGERQETFTVQINSATNAKIDGAVAIGRIIDDDVIVAPVSTINATVVAVHALSNGAKYLDGGSGAYGISDPSALVYIPSLGALYVGDSEHDESPFFSPTNLFSLGLDGSFNGNFSLSSFTSEPTGLAYNSNNGLLYIADDDTKLVNWVSPTNPTVRLGSFDTARLGFVDTEDLKFDPVTGHIHILDGLMKQLIELTDQGVFVNSIPLPAVMTDAEALAYDSTHDVFFIASGASSLIWVMNPQGGIVATLNTLSSYSPFPKIKGMELAPSSNPNDGDTLSLYVTDYGVDQFNDGRLFEINLGSDWFA